MPLTPLDAEKARFRVGFRGYAREEVERFRATVVAALEDHIGQAQQLKARVAELEAQLASFREKEELLKNSVVLAQRTCDELIAAAHQKADAIRRAALLEGDEIRRELAELRSQREQFEYAFHGLLTGFKHRLEQGNPRLAAPAERRQLAGSEMAPADREADAIGPQAAGAADAEAGLPDAGLPPDRPVRAPAESMAEYASPPPPPAPPRPAARAPGEAEVDRDADIADFSAALDQAPAAAPAWLQAEQESPVDTEPEEETAEPASEDDQPRNEPA